MERHAALSTIRVARAAGCSAQLVRDLEAAGVVPPADRAPNGYRRFTAVHVGAIRGETREDDADVDAMTITQLADALGVRPSTLRYWELEGLVRPERRGRLQARSYPAGAIREARIVSALRTSGRSIPATAQVMTDLRDHGGVDALRTVLAAHLEDVARRTEQLLRAGTSLVDLRSALAGR